MFYVYPFWVGLGELQAARLSINSLAYIGVSNIHLQRSASIFHRRASAEPRGPNPSSVVRHE